MLNRLWAWVKSMVDRLFRRNKPTVEDGVRRAGNIVDAGGKYVSTRRGGPNMPKRQPCPKCHASVRRTRKTMGGAHYYCKRCQADNFVKAR